MNTEEFWRGDFGNEYLKRNEVDYESRLPFWRSAVRFMAPRNVLEVGCNRAHNLIAIKSIDHDIECEGVDVNEAAVEQAIEQGVKASVCAARDIKGKFDLTFTAGVLIHIAPEDLRPVMQAIIDSSRKYVMAIEYEAEQEEEVLYRGHTGKLWKRPFGDLYRAMGLRLVSFGDAAGFERCTFWLMEKDMTGDTYKQVEAETGWQRR